jgi:hypothetical protein
LIFEKELHEIYAEFFKNIGENLAKQFEINFDTLHEDIAISIKEVKAKVPNIKFVVASKKSDETLRNFKKATATSREEAMAASKAKAKDIIKKYFGSGIIKILPKDVAFTISVKNFLTMSGGEVESLAGDIGAALPGNPSLYNEITGASRELPGALEWKGYLDLTDDKQFATAMKYASAKKSK